MLTRANLNIPIRLFADISKKKTAALRATVLSTPVHTSLPSFTHVIQILDPGLRSLNVRLPGHVK